MKQSDKKELMDLPGQSREILEEDLRNLRAFNRWLGGGRAVVKGLKLAVQSEGFRNFSLLDIGTGSADLPSDIVHWSRRRGIGAKIIALEREPVTAAVAAVRTQRFPEISVVQGDAAWPPFPPSSFDFIVASQLLHHFSEEAVVSNLQLWSGIARKAIIVGDLVRHPLAYYGIRLLSRLSTRNVMTLTDAPLSVKRAFTLNEWRNLFARANVGRCELFPVFPFRVTAILRLKSDHAKL